MNDPYPWLNDEDMCRRMMDLSFSLYECLGDLMADVVAWDEPDHYDREELLERIRLSSMNCMADINLLIPIYQSVQTYGLESIG